MMWTNENFFRHLNIDIRGNAAYILANALASEDLVVVFEFVENSEAEA